MRPTAMPKKARISPSHWIGRGFALMLKDENLIEALDDAEQNRQRGTSGQALPRSLRAEGELAGPTALDEL